MDIGGAELKRRTEVSQEEMHVKQELVISSVFSLAEEAAESMGDKKIPIKKNKHLKNSKSISVAYSSVSVYVLTTYLPNIPIHPAFGPIWIYDYSNC